jgi:hypothetical protein
MSNLAKIDKIISEVNGLEEKDKIILFHKIEKIFDNSEEQINADVSLESVFGLWKDRDISVESIRQKAWKQNLILQDDKKYNFSALRAPGPILKNLCG